MIHNSLTLNEIITLHGKWLNNDDGGKRADLSDADLSGANLREADLRWAELHSANLQGANLRFAKLCGAGLRSANLHRVNLFGANLCGADLRDADLSDVILSNADLRGAILSEKIIQVGPIGSQNSYTVYFVDQDIVQCGCWKEYRGESLEQFKSRINEEYPDGRYREEYLLVIEMFERMRNYRETKK